MKQPQGRVLIELLKKFPMTTGDMEQLRISQCPWKRISEQLKPHEKLVKAVNGLGLTVYSVKVVRECAEA
jgi:hypothetical protein